MPGLMRKSALRCLMWPYRITRHANVPPSCAAKNSRNSAAFLAQPARRTIPSVPAWCLRKGRVPHSTVTAAGVRPAPRKACPMPTEHAASLDLVSGQVELNHGAGGRAMQQLISQVFARELGNEFLAQGDDGARLPVACGRLVMATDAHVV